MNKMKEVMLPTGRAEVSKTTKASDLDDREHSAGQQLLTGPIDVSSRPAECNEGPNPEMPSRRQQPVRADKASNLKTVLSRSHEGLLLCQQLAESVYVPSGSDQAVEHELRDGAIALYCATEPADAIESMMLRQMVGLNNASMECLGRANLSGQTAEARALDLRISIKATSAFAEMAKAYNTYRGRRQKVTIGKVNVESRGRAIVGNIESGRRQERASPLVERDQTDNQEPSE